MNPPLKTKVNPQALLERDTLPSRYSTILDDGLPGDIIDNRSNALAECVLNQNCLIAARPTASHSLPSLHYAHEYN